MTEHFDELTKSHKEVANYFLYNLDKVAVGTLEDLAGLVGVSTTTVIRFARQLGYSGFTELQKDAQNIVLNKDMIPEQPESGSPDQKVSSRLATSFERDIRNIENTMKDLKEEDLDRAVSLMQSADSLYIMSMRMGFSLAYYAFASWGRLRRDIRLLRFTGMEYPEGDGQHEKGGRMRRLCIPTVHLPCNPSSRMDEEEAGKGYPGYVGHVCGGQGVC